MPSTSAGQTRFAIKSGFFLDLSSTSWRLVRPLEAVKKENLLFFTTSKHCLNGLRTYGYFSEPIYFFNYIKKLFHIYIYVVLNYYKTK